MEDADLQELFPATVGHRGYCVGSISRYRESFPGQAIIKNACLATRERGPIWDGDLDLTEKESGVQTIAAELGETVYVLFESSAWPDFHSSSSVRVVRFGEAFAVVEPDGEVSFDLIQAYRADDGRLLACRAH